MTVTIRATSMEAAAHQAAVLEAQGISCVIEVTDMEMPCNGLDVQWPSVVSYMEDATSAMGTAIAAYMSAAALLRYGGDHAGAAEVEEVAADLGHAMASYRPDPDEGGCWSGA